MTIERRHFGISLAILSCFYVLIFLLSFIIERFIIRQNIFGVQNFLNWDAMHYATIRDHGYTTGMVAFFPLFPWIWNLSGTGPLGISVLNGILYLISMAAISTTYRIEGKKLVLLASIPVLMFMFLPYSEAAFFMACTVMLAGMKKDSFILILSGCILAGIARPVATIFIPAFLLTWWLTGENNRSGISKVLIPCIACAASFMAVLAFQYMQTGKFLLFFEVQKNWENYLRMPSLPFDSWAGGFIVRLDALAFFFGLCSLAFIIYLCFFQKRKITDWRNRKGFIFSISYLAILTIVVLFTRGGILNSLNRYLLCTPFFIVAISEALQHIRFSPRSALYLFLGSSTLWLVFASFVHIQTLLKFEFLTAYLIVLLAITASNRIVKNSAFAAILICNCIFMLIFYYRFLTGQWVG